MATSKIRFYLDENVHHHIADGLRHRGIEVLTTPEAEHMGWPDEKHLSYALVEGYVILTQDSDFLRLHSQGIPHAGIVYYKPDDRTVKQIIAGAVLIYDALTPEEMMNHVEYLCCICTERQKCRWMAYPGRLCLLLRYGLRRD